MKKYLRFDFLSITLVLNCIIFGSCLTYLFISEGHSRERMIFFLLTITAFVSCLTFILLLRDARQHEEVKERK